MVCSTPIGGRLNRKCKPWLSLIVEAQPLVSCSSDIVGPMDYSQSLLSFVRKLGPVLGRRFSYRKRGQ